MKIKGTINNIKEAGDNRVRVAVTIADSAMNGNFNSLMTVVDAKAAGFYPGDECEITMDIKSLGKPPAKDAKPRP
jgi:hypothetical protein